MSALRAAPSRTWDDAALVEACLAGDERAWAALIEKYKNLVYSIPRKYRMSPEDSADIFQNVWLDVYRELPRLKSAGSLRSWLLTVASHQAFHRKRREVKRAAREGAALEEAPEAVSEEAGAELLEQAEREQTLREAVAALSGRCQELIRLLFYEQPPLPYGEVAGRLGLAVGSIGFIRGRCLKQLQRRLDDVGF